MFPPTLPEELPASESWKLMLIKTITFQETFNWLFLEQIYIQLLQSLPLYHELL